MELGIVLGLVALMLALWALSERSVKRKRHEKADIFTELRGQPATVWVTARVSIGRLRQTAKVHARMGEVLEREGTLRLTLGDTEAVDVGRVFLGQEAFVAEHGIALDDIVRVVTDDGTEHGWGIGNNRGSDQP